MLTNKTTIRMMQLVNKPLIPVNKKKYRKNYGTMILEAIIKKFKSPCVYFNPLFYFYFIYLLGSSDLE